MYIGESFYFFNFFTKHIYIPSNGIEGKADRTLGFLQRRPELLDLLSGQGSVVPDPEIGGLHVAKDRDEHLPVFHNRSQLVQAEIRVAVSRGEDRHPDSAPSYRCLDLVRELVAWLQAIAVEERPETEPAEPVVEQPRHVPFRVGPTVVDEHVARRAAEFAGYGGDFGGGYTLHEPKVGVLVFLFNFGIIIVAFCIYLLKYLVNISNLGNVG